MIALALGAGAVQAQQGDQQQGPPRQGRFNRRGPGGDGRHEGFGGGRMLAGKLHFSDQQKQQLKDINSQYRKQLTDLNKNLDITVREQHAKLADLRKSHLQQVEALYTPEQKTQIQKMKDERKQMAEVNAKARAEKMKIRLGLSDDQAQKLKDLRTATASKMKDLRSNQSLSTDQKREQIRKIIAEQKEQMKSVLTPDQQKQMEQMHRGHQRGDWNNRNKTA